MADKNYYIGIMSGTSSDGADAVLARTNPRFELVATHSRPFDRQLQESIHQLADSQSATIDKLGEMDSRLGEVFAETALELLQKTGIKSTEVVAIGSHGQTVRHRPSSPSPFTIQIGDPNIIAYKTGITTVADFRRRDIAAGGQGAPLVPAFHHSVFSSGEVDRAIVNIGGMANVSWLPKSLKVTDVIGFDTGPGNVLMDSWISIHLQHNYDQKGAWAASGKLHKKLLDFLLSEDFFQQAPPKSTGRELFNLPWLKRCLLELGEHISAVDIQRTLLELTAKSIADAVNRLSISQKEIYICGGGAFNDFLMQRLAELLSPYNLTSTESLGVAPQWVEAMTFGWLAYRRMENKPGNICAVTGAKEACVLGAIYPGRCN